MTLKELKGVGRMLTSFLLLFSSCFRSLGGRKLLRVYVHGLLSDVPRKNCEAVTLECDTCPRTRQRFLELIKWDEDKLRDRCQEIVVRDFEVHGWRCIHRHCYLSGLSFLLCSRIRQSLDKNETGRLTVEHGTLLCTARRITPTTSYTSAVST